MKESKFQHPLGILKWNEKLIISDSYNHKLKIIEGDLVSNFIGIGTPGHEDSKDFSKVKFNDPSGMCILNDYLYVADTNNHCIRCIDLIQNLCSTVEFKLKSEENEEKFIYLESLNCQENEKIQFKMIINLPIGCHLNETAPSKWKINSSKGKIEAFKINSCLLNVECEFTKEIQLKCQIYYCSNELCLMKELLFKIKTQIGKEKEMRIFQFSFDK